MATTADGQGAVITLDLRPVSAEAFAAAAGPPPGVAPVERDATPAPPAPERDGRLRVMLDPGHGGHDPGAVHGGAREADITLATARALRDALRRDGRFDVAMTREADVFVTLEGRIAAARAHGADLFLSIHADAVPEGVARGAQLWTLSEEASSRAGELLAQRHNRADLLGGADLTGQDDAVAAVLMDIARTETAPRSDALADALVEGLRAAGIRLHRRPRESAGFAVLRAPDIPSVLVEIGFMSSPGELDLLTSPEWRARVAEGLARGIAAWVDRDAARAALGLR
jgi:N-acetylmuramoyl-L-alanine amidase